MNFWPSKEDRRIELFFDLYKSSKNRGNLEEASKVILIEELSMGGKLLKDQFDGLDYTTKLNQIEKLFYPLKIIDYDVFELINFLMVWEFPKKYNYMPSIEQIRSGKHPLAALEISVKQIGSKILADSENSS